MLLYEVLSYVPDITLTIKHGRETQVCEAVWRLGTTKRTTAVSGTSSEHKGSYWSAWSCSTCSGHQPLPFALGYYSRNKYSTPDTNSIINFINPLNAELNPMCHMLAILGAHHIFHISGLRVKQKKKYPKTKRSRDSC